MYKNKRLKQQNKNAKQVRKGLKDPSKVKGSVITSPITPKKRKSVGSVITSPTDLLKRAHARQKQAHQLIQPTGW